MNYANNTTAKQPLRVGIVVGEASGDSLGADLMQQMRTTYGEVEFVGIGGPQMLAQGCNSLYAMENLAVMGLLEVLKRLRQLFAIRDGLVSHFTSQPIDLFIGIDAPDFNLRLAPQLKALGVPTVQYVSPSVWAWRQGRVAHIKQTIDLVLCLFPFESAFYHQHQVNAQFVGHPLANTMPIGHDVGAAKLQLGYGASDTVIGLLPGSRSAEVARLLPLMLEAASALISKHPQLRFAIAAANPLRELAIRNALSAYPQLTTVVKVHCNSDSEANIGRLVMAASDLVLLASGTATLEAMLLGRPMAIVYKTHPITYLLVKAMLKIPYVGLPNILAGQQLAPEYIQHQATAANISKWATKLLTNPTLLQQQTTQLQALHRQLQSNNATPLMHAIAPLLPLQPRKPT